MARSRRENSTSRRGPYRQSSTRILVVCGGLRTEREYLDSLRRWRHNPAVKIRVLGKGCAPRDLVRHAGNCREQRHEDFDEVWCVFDVDEYPHVSDAVSLARRENILVAVSNPCFELWLLLHFESCAAHLPRYASVLSRLEKHVGGYNKAVEFVRYQDRVDDAIERARGLDPSGEAYGSNPSTGMWRLVERIVREG